MRIVAVLLVAVAVKAEPGKECHPMDPNHPKESDLWNCHRECNLFTEWCVPNNTSSTGWACDHKPTSKLPPGGKGCVEGGGSVFCSNCPAGMFCQNDGPDGWECDELSNGAPQSTALHSLTTASESGNALCSPCVQLGGQGINILLNYILNAGVVEGCGKLCSNLKSKGSQKVCDLVCGVVGIKAFIKALNHTDLDPIYFCEILHACPAAPDDAAMTIMSVSAQPTSVAKGDTIELSVLVNVTNASGVGEFGVSVDGPVTQPVSQRFLLPNGVPVGQQNLAVKLTVQDDDSGDFPVVWQPGTYRFALEVCQGECHSKHPHSKFFGSQASNFTLTENDAIAI